MLKKLLFSFVRKCLSLRYRVHVRGLESLRRALRESPHGALLLPNHPSELDPVLITLFCGGRKTPRPLIVEQFFYSFPRLMHWLGAIPIPNFDNGQNSYKAFCLERSYHQMTKALYKGDAILLYPAGQLKRQGKEVLGGKSMLKSILERVDRPRIILARTEGMWGSSFSTIENGQTPDFAQVAWQGIKDLLRAGLFFMPKREVTITFEVVEDFPYEGTKQEVNQYLERWYNQYHLPSGEVVEEEPVQQVARSFWEEPKRKDTTFRKKQQKVDLSKIPQEIQQDIYQCLALISEKPIEQLQATMHLSADLGLDSLNIAEVVAHLQQQYGVEEVRPDELSDIASVMAFAGKQVEPSRSWQVSPPPKKQWQETSHRPRAEIPKEQTIGEAFLCTAARMQGQLCCADALAGALTYDAFLYKVVLLANWIEKHTKDQHIGVLLPASTGCYATILAILLAGKVPVMFNWTCGPRNLASMKETAGVQVCLTSNQFLSALQGVDVSPLHESFYLLENLRMELSPVDLVKAYLSSKRKRKLLDAYRKKKVSGEDPAVILFTSGTESFPKGVPLSHKNLLANAQSSLASIQLDRGDILYGALPPFHSFGFAVTGLLPILSGLRVAFTPNPTHAMRLAQGIRKWKATCVCLPPTFLRSVLRAGHPPQFRSLRLVVTGAERLPDDLKELFAQKAPSSCALIEGYGATECSPVLAVNRPDEKLAGVGRALQGVQLKVVHPTTHKLQPQGETGIVVALGENVFSGYLGDIAKDPFIQLDGQNWYNTGDLGYFDANACLHIVGRLKRFVKIGGEMISLPAMEEAFMDYALQEKWPLADEEPQFVVLSQEEQKSGKPKIALASKFNLSVKEANEVLRKAGFSNLIKVHAVHEVDRIPILATGKTDYRALEEMLFSV